MAVATFISKLRKQNSRHGRVFASTALVSVVTLAAKLLAGGKEALIGARFGVGDQVDIFLVAVLLPTVFTNVLSVCLSLAFIPQFAKAKTVSGREGHTLYSSIFLIGALAAMAASISLYVLGKPILGFLAPGFAEAKLNITVRCFFVIIPMLLFSGATNLWSGVLNTESRFFIPSFAPVVTTLTTVLLVLMVKAPGLAPYYLSIAITIGAAFECILVGVALHKTGFLVLPKLGPWHSDTKTVVKEFLYLSLGNLTISAVPIINQWFASRLGSGMIAAVNYGTRIPALVLSVASTSIAAVILPHFSKLVAEGRWTELKHAARYYMTIVTLILIPVTAVLVWQSHFLVQLTFQRGYFTASDTTIVAQVQAWYILQLPFVIPGLIGNRLLMSLEASRLYILVSLINVGITVLLSSVFVRWLGVPGLGASTSAMNAIATTLLISMAWAKLRRRAASSQETTRLVAQSVVP